LSKPQAARSVWPDLGICLILLLATLAVYGQVRHFDFLNYDDPGQVSQNVHVRDGLTPEGLAWVLTSGEDGNWFPVTRISYLIDYQLSGLDAGMFHLTNLLFHALTTLLVFALFRRTTGSRWGSAFVAFMFALHPLHVQSVAWITERKGVLSGLFWFAALLAYVHYVRRPCVRRYLLVVALFCLALMAKAVVVTLPLALLLLDIWPLRRISLDAKPKAGVLWEKAPLLALSFGFTAAGYVLQGQLGALDSSDSLSLAQRLGNAFNSYLVYILQMFWPTRLAAFYPYDRGLPAWQVGAAALTLLAITFVALRWLRRRPWFAVGWFWYLGTLVPMIGLVQVGAPSHADRYTYIPEVGLWIILAWGAAELVARWPRAKPAVAGLATAGCAACLCLTWFEVRHWENTITLFRRAIQVTSRNWVAYNNLGYALRSQGQIDEAIANFHRALEIRGGYVELTNLGDAYQAQGRYEEAARYSSAALAINPASAEAHLNLGVALAGLGRASEAEAQFRQAVRLRPEDAHAHNDLGIALSSQGRASEALEEFTTAVRLNPEYANAQFDLGAALANSGRLREAVAHFSEALRIQPGFRRAREGLESVSARLRESGKQ
jgi:tetratricopeptide (TPR) repeat protein